MLVGGHLYILLAKNINFSCVCVLQTWAKWSSVAIALWLEICHRYIQGWPVLFCHLRWNGHLCLLPPAPLWLSPLNLVGDGALFKALLLGFSAWDQGRQTAGSYARPPSCWWKQWGRQSAASCTCTAWGRRRKETEGANPFWQVWRQDLPPQPTAQHSTLSMRALLAQEANI